MDDRIAYIESVLRSYFEEEEEEEEKTEQVSTDDSDKQQLKKATPSQSPSNVRHDKAHNSIEVHVDGQHVSVDLATLGVTMDGEQSSDLRKRVHALLQEAMVSILPLGEPWSLSSSAAAAASV